MIRFFVFLYTYFRSHKIRLGALLVFLTAGFLFSLLHLEYKEDISDFLPDNAANEQIHAVYRHVGNSDKLIIYFAMRDTTLHDAERIMEAIDRFTVLLEERDSLQTIPEVLAQVDESRMFDLMTFIRENAPYFLTATDYHRMDTLLSAEYVAFQLAENKRLLMLPSGSLMKQAVVSDPLHLFSPLLLKLNDFQAGNQEEPNNGYLFTRNGKKGMVILTSPYGVSETDKNTSLLSLIDQTMQEAMQVFPDIRITCLGAPAIAVTNAGQIKKDSLLAIALAVVLILVLLIYFFRSGRTIFFIFISVLFGWLFALGILAVFKDSISVIAVGISSVFVGIAINYPLHFIDHLKHQPDKKQTLKEIVPPLLIGNITTVGAFLSLAFLDAGAMRDLGLFGSLLLIGTIVFVLVCLPHLVGAGKMKGKEGLIFGKLASFAPETKKWILAPVLILTGLFLYLSQFTTFEADMNQINYMTGQQREDMHDMLQSIEKKGKEVIYFISEGEQLDDALNVYERNTPLLDSLRQQGLIESMAGIGVFLVSREEQQRRIDRWNDFWLPRRESLLQQIETQAKKEGFKAGSFHIFSQLLYRDFRVQEEDYFEPVTSLLANNYLIKESGKNRVICLLYSDKEKTEALETALANGISGQTFFFDSRNIGQRMVDSLSGDFNYVLYICGFIVFIFLTLSFGRFELSLLSFLPLAVSWIWILGLMQLGDIRFNIVNIILATFIFGQGDDYTIFITEGLMYEYTYRRKMLAAYKNSIILSALIMLIGIGTLIFAKHPALRSLAEVTVVGMFSVVMMAYLIPPLIFRWLTTTKKGYREVPVTFKRLFSSVYSFTAFLMGSLVITVAGVVLLGFKSEKIKKLGELEKLKDLEKLEKLEKRKLRYHSVSRVSKSLEKRKSLYHALLCWIARFVIKHIPGVNFHYENPVNETFDKPAVIISNHQSHLDLMCLMMLTPRLVILTNDWVWNNPFYGRLIKYADFYPVSNGIDQSLDRLADRVRNGYSIVVFPEGTRSEDCSVLRFHRGAFYLAETLKLDILPVVIHGVGHVLPKKDFMLREGSITVQVQPRITPNDMHYGADYTARAKQIRQYYRDTFAQLSQRCETAAYYKPFVLYNYLYKGAGIERNVRRELKKDTCWINQYAGKGPVLIKNNGLGVSGFLFALVHKNVQVIAVDRDEDNVALARHCVGIPSNLTVCHETELPDTIAFETVFDLNIATNAGMEHK